MAWINDLATIETRWSLKTRKMDAIIPIVTESCKQHKRKKREENFHPCTYLWSSVHRPIEV